MSTRAWPRFRSYEVVNGRLQPSSDDFEAHDAWQRFMPGEGSGPQQDLLDLIHAYRTRPASDFDTYLTEWAARNGLLGLGLARLVFTRYRIADDHGWAASRAAGRLLLRQVLIGTEEPFAFMNKMTIPAAVYAAADDFDELAVVNQSIGDGWCDTSTPSDYWRAYIPSFDDSPPAIGSDDFWRRYSEPVSEIVAAADLFAREAYRGVGLWMLAADATLTQERDAVRWNSASLIGGFAAMALQEQAGGYVYQQCDCGIVFPARRYQDKEMRKYCSDRCKSRVKARRRRSNATSGDQGGDAS